MRRNSKETFARRWLAHIIIPVRDTKVIGIRTSWRCALHSLPHGSE